MQGLLLAIPLMCLAPGDGVEYDPMNSKREVDPFSVTLEIFQPLEESLPFLGLRMTGVFDRRFGIEGSVSKVFVLQMAELSALRVLRIAGDPLLLRAGLSGGSGGRESGSAYTPAPPSFPVTWATGSGCGSTTPSGGSPDPTAASRPSGWGW